MLHHAIFLDRDGTINVDTGYLKKTDEVIILPGVSQGIRKLKDTFGFKIVVISNQAGVAKGLITLEDVEDVNKRVAELLKADGALIDSFYYCPFHPDFNSKEEANCRKPSPEMIFNAAKDLSIDLTRSYMVGDRSSDIECGINANVKTVLLQSIGFQSEISSLHKLGKKPNFVAANFNEACDFIIKDFGGC